jgi:5-methylcytosine-specific restriction endonuclease McrA
VLSVKNKYNIVEKDVTCVSKERMKSPNMVFVLDTNRKPLAPCHSAVARKLLKRRKASIFKRYPFTIILNKEVKEDNKQEFRLKIDYGSRYTGLAILQNNNVLWMGQINHRTNIKSNLDSRRIYRHKRRNKKLRYREVRFLNRKKNKGWIPPSLESRVNNIRTWVNRLQKVIPLTHISYENCKFDTQLMKSPEISSVEYQQGVLQGYEVREYLLEKYNRKCCYCGKENTPLEVEHIIPKSRGGTNRIDNLCLACHDCNNAKGNMTAEEFGYPNIQKQVKQTLKDCAVLNATRWKVYETLCNTGLPVECGTGARTKMNRINLDLPKEHYYDACCIGQSTPKELYFKTCNVSYIKAKGRGSHCRTNIDKYGFPRGYLTRHKYMFGFQTGDMVKAIILKGRYKGMWYGEVACRETGTFDIKNKKGQRVVQSVNYKNCAIVQRFDGYSYG